MLKNKPKLNKNLNKKQKLAVFSLSIILIISVISITGVLPLASLFGGDSSNVYGGTFSTSASSQSGQTITSFTETGVSQIDLSITNNVIASSFTPPEYENYKSVPVTITSSADVTGYAVKIPITYTSKMKTDLSDIRFKLADGTELPQHRESYVDSTSAVYWIKTDLTIGDNTVYMEYGNGVSLKDEPALVFTEYFDKTSTSGWTTSGISITTEGEYLRFYNPTTSTTGGATRYGLTLPTKYMMESQIKTVSVGSNDRFLFITLDGSTSHRKSFSSLPQVTDQNNWYYYDGDVYQSIGSYTEGTEYVHKHINDDSNSATGTNYYLYDLSGNLLSSATGKAASVGTPTDTDGIWLGDITTTGVCDVRIKYIRFREYIPSEPTVSFGTATDVSLEFTRRQTITIDNTGKTALSGYQWKEALTYDSDMDSNFADIIVTETDGTVVKHFKENIVESTSIDLWFPVTVGADTTKDYYVYYGCPTFEDTSDSSVFPVYDDFNDGTYTDKWDIVDIDGSGTATITETSGYLDLYATCPNVGTSPSIEAWSKITIPAGNYIIEGESKATSTNEYKTRQIMSVALFDSTKSTSGAYGTIDLQNTNTIVVSDGTTSSHTTSVAYNNFAPLSLIYSPTIVQYAYNGDFIADNTPQRQVYDDEMYIRLRNSYTNGQAGNCHAYYDWIRARQYTATPPTSSISSEETLENPTIVASCTGDSDSQQYIIETKEITLTPSGDISQFAIDGSGDYDFIATIHYTGDVVVVENATEGNMTITFTPDVTIESGFVNGIFTEDIAFEEYTISATLDDIATENVFLENNNTISMQLTSCDNTEHVAAITITEASTPSTPSSSGGGGGGSTTPATEVEETTTEEVIVQSTEDSEQIVDFSVLTTDGNNMIIYAILTIFAVLIIYIIGKVNKK